MRVAALLLVASAQTWAGTCVLPKTDSSPRSLSAPSIEGWVSSVEERKVTLKRKDGSSKPSQSALLTDKTEFFGSGGGWIALKDLSAGNYVRIWFSGCKPYNSKKSAVAAVVILN